MLAGLHVKNLALIDEEEIFFGPGLNILSGETGAGKSIILGALHLSLGDKASKEMLRDTQEEAFVEAVYTVTDERQKAALRQMDIEPYDDQVIMSRKITEARSVAKINGEQVPANKMKEAGEILLDIYGQKEHQSLLNKHRHLELLDEYAKDELLNLKAELKNVYVAYKEKQKELSEANTDDANRDREMSLLDYEISEIEAASLKLGEDEDLEEEYKRLNNFSKIMEGFSKAYESMGLRAGASDAISSAIAAIRPLESVDEKARELLSILSDAEAIVSDFNRDISDYMSEASFDQERFNQVESRLNEINRLKDKYGFTIETILDELKKRQEKKNRLLSLDTYLLALKDEVRELESKLLKLSDEVSAVRKKAAFSLSSLMQDAMSDLNFLNADFSMSFERLDHFTDNGIDDCQFMISTNPGEPLRPLKDIASGGEMSRIMLAIKTVMASKDDIDTLIFDEIDAGISGRTAQAVSEKLKTVARDHQVICITHLPQIAAQADTHFLIEKNVVLNHTVSGIRRLNEDDSVLELARMLGGTTITDTVINNAKEMRALAHK